MHFPADRKGGEVREERISGAKRIGSTTTRGRRGGGGRGMEKPGIKSVRICGGREKDVKGDDS